jgi:hypothetical protein
MIGDIDVNTVQYSVALYWLPSLHTQSYLGMPRLLWQMEKLRDGSYLDYLIQSVGSA